MELRSGTLSQPSTSAAQPPPAGTSRPPSPVLTTPTAVGSNSIQPPQPWPVWHPSSRQRDPKVFSGLGDEEIEEWLDIYERISTYNRWDNANKLANIIFYFTDVAKTWYLNHETEWHTWEAFTTRAKEIFGRPENRRATAERRLNFRVQQQGESYTAYIEDVLRLCRRANEQMQEGERVRHLLKGISEEAFAMFLNQPPPDVNAVVSGCTRLAEARQHRVLSLGAALDYSDEFVADALAHTHECRRLARSRISDQQLQSKIRYDKVHRNVNYSPGDEVLVAFPLRKPGLCQKFLPRYVGPYRIVRQTSPVNYLVQLLNPPSDARTRDPDVVHVTRIKAYHRHENGQDGLPPEGGHMLEAPGCASWSAQHAARAQETRARQS
ncbi:hypothetical protein ISCGN_005498 [Ixodes scapularis]